MIDEIKELIEEKKYQEVKNKIIDLEEADIAEILCELETKDLIKIFRLIPKDTAALVFSYLPIENEQDIINSLSTTDAASIIDNMAADDAADLMEEMPANVVKRLLSKTTNETRRDINLLLNYPEDSAGSIMTVEFIDLKESNTVKQAIEKIKKNAKDIESIDTCFVLDSKRKLIGIVTLKDLILSDYDELIGNIMTNYETNITTLTDQEEVAKQFQKYDVTSMPVVDSENRLVGIITIDDIVDIIQEETTEDIEKMAAITPTDKPYLKTSVFEIWKKRIPWLLLLMVSATFTGGIINNFEASLAIFPVLTAFIPMLMDTGGNSGSQASVTIIRGIAINEIEAKNTFKIVFKEIRVALLCGITLAIANFIKIILIDNLLLKNNISITVAFVISLTLIFTVAVAKIIGSTLPIFAKKLKLDPAVMASPFITTIVDAISLIAYFNIARMLLGI